MATTIITKSGSGAPLAGDLQVAELALDLTNKKLYSKEGTTVFEVGATGGGASGTFTDLTATNSFTSVGIDDNATSTAITIDASQNVGIGGSPVSSIRRLMVTDTGDVRVDIRSGADTNLGAIDFSDTSNTARGQLIYDHNDDSMQFKTLSSERMRIDSSGNVGIGETTPNSVLHVNSGTGNNTAFFESTDNGAIVSIADNAGSIQLRAIDTGDFVVQVGGDGATTGTNSTEAMRIDSSGNVGIGTASPSSYYGTELVVSSSDEGGITLAAEGTTYTNYLLFADGTSGDARFRGQIGYDHNTDSLSLVSSGYARINTGSSRTEAMRITSDGNVLVGQTNASTVVNGAYFRTNGSGFIATSTDCLMLNRQGTDGTIVDIRNDNTTVGTISISGSSTAYNTSSDERLKENIVDASAGNIDAIRVRSFDWKADGAHQPHGMIAQELVDVAPEAVTQGETDDDMWQVDYSKLVPMMIKEIQDLRARVAQLEGA